MRVSGSGATGGVVGDKPVFGAADFCLLDRHVADHRAILYHHVPITSWAELEANEALWRHRIRKQYDLQVQLMVIKWGLMHGIIRAIYSISMENWKGRPLANWSLGLVVANNDGGKASLAIDHFAQHVWTLSYQPDPVLYRLFHGVVERQA